MTDRMDRIILTASAELPSIAITWRDANDALIPFVTEPHTFQLTVDTNPTFVKGVLGGDQTGITASDTDPNVTIAFAPGDLDNLRAGFYGAQLWARRTADGKDRAPLRFDVEISRRQPIDTHDHDLAIAVTATVTGTDVL